MTIKLSKAREIIHLNIQEASDSMPPDVKESLKLADEALGLIFAIRHGAHLSVFEWLPSEEHNENQKPTQ